MCLSSRNTCYLCFKDKMIIKGLKDNMQSLTDNASDDEVNNQCIVDSTTYFQQVQAQRVCSNEKIKVCKKATKKTCTFIIVILQLFLTSPKTYNCLTSRRSNQMMHTTSLLYHSMHLVQLIILQKLTIYTVFYVIKVKERKVLTMLLASLNSFSLTTSHQLPFYLLLNL